MEMNGKILIIICIFENVFYLFFDASLIFREKKCADIFSI